MFDRSIVRSGRTIATGTQLRTRPAVASFGRRSPPSEKALFIYVLALLLIGVALGSAVWTAVVEGTVTVVQIGKYSATTEVVPWTQGWARFIGPVLLLGAVETWRRTRRFWTPLALALAGLVLLSCSIWFTSFARALAFMAWTALILASLIVGNRFGRVAVFALLAAALALAIWAQGGL